VITGLRSKAIIPGGCGHFGVIFVLRSYRRTNADSGRIITTLEEKLNQYPAKRIWPMAGPIDALAAGRPLLRQSLATG
jgi:hypothetical protein